MKSIAFFILSLFTLSAELFASVSFPDLLLDGQQVISPNIGAAVIPNGGFQTFQVCLNDNPAGTPADDLDFNDGCASAAFTPGNVLTLTYIGAFTSATNYIGVLGQPGLVGPGTLELAFTYLPGVETIFTGYVNGGATAVYLSGSGKASNNPPGDYFFSECVLCIDGGEDVQTPEPSGFALIALGLAGMAWARKRFN